MKRAVSTTCLVDADYLEENTQSIYDSDGNSSGYESSGSTLSLTSSLPSPPSPPRPLPNEVMIYTNMVGLSESLNYILDMPELCDVTFLVGECQTPLHGVKAIIATRSRVFYQMILQSQRISEEKKKTRCRLRLRPKKSPKTSKPIIHVSDYEPEVFATLLKFLHTGRVRVQLRTVIGLLCAAVEFELPDLQTACVDFATRCISHGQLENLDLLTSGYVHRKRVMKLLHKINKHESPAVQ